MESDKTHEAIRVWSQYAIWTSDTGTYGPNIRAAQTYCNLHPAWLEGGGLGYYSAHNCGWGFEAVKKYREAYNDTTWNWYGDSCATWMVANPLNWQDMLNAFAEALGLGGMYSHAAYRERQDWVNHCITRGRALRTWLQASPNRLYAESWALSGGTAVWGLTETLFAAYPDSGAIWVEQWGGQVQVWESAGSWNHSSNCWYANAQHRMFELSGDSVYWENAVYICDSLIGLDTDEDGGIPPGWSYPATNDHSWVSAYMGWMGMERIINVTPGYDMTVAGFASPNPLLPHLAGDVLDVAVRISNTGRSPISGWLLVSGNGYSDSAYVTVILGVDTVVTLSSPWIVPDDNNMEEYSSLFAEVSSADDEDAENDTLTRTFDIRHQVNLFGVIQDAANPNTGIPASIEIFHEAYPDSAWTTLLTDGDGEYQTSERPLMEGLNRVVALPAVQFMAGTAEVTLTQESSPYELDIAVDHTELALVDDDVNQTYETWYLSSLDSFPELNVRHWDRSTAALTSLNEISTVIWFCGNDSNATLDPSDHAVLDTYVSGGGNLLLTGQNITEDESAAPFLNTVLHCSLRTRNTNIRSVAGATGNPQWEDVLLVLIGQNGAWNQTSPSSIYVLDGGTQILQYTSGDDEACGVSGERGEGKYIFLSFGLEAASGASPSWTRDEFLTRCFQWFDSGTFTEPIPELPAQIWLAQNYPNPFNPATTIRFYAPPGTAPVSLVIYNLLGQRVRTLLQEAAFHGENVILWDGMTDAGRTATSGMYVYQLQAGTTRLTRTLQLIR